MSEWRVIDAHNSASERERVTQRTASGPLRNASTKARGRRTKLVVVGTSAGVRNVPRVAIESEVEGARERESEELRECGCLSVTAWLLKVA